MVAEVKEIQAITSLKRAPDGRTWQPGRDWGAAHPAYRPFDKTSPCGRREDAEPTADLPTLTPGLHHLPEQCSNCSSHFLNREDAQGPHQRGLITCGRCSRQLCWLAPSIATRVQSAGAAPSTVAPPSRSAPPLRPIVTREIEQLEGCGPACSRAYGHDPATHFEEGWRKAQAGSSVKPRGQVRTGPLVVDFDTGTTSVDGQPAPLTVGEQKIMEALATRPGRLYPRFELVETVWDRATAESQMRRKGRSYSHLLNTHLARLRAKLGPSCALIETRPGVGLVLRAVPTTETTEEPNARPRARLRSRGLHHRLALGPGRAGGLVVARSRQAGVSDPPFRHRREARTMTPANGTATIETVAPAITVTEPAVTSLSELLAVSLAPSAVAAPAATVLPVPGEPQPSALDQALGWFADVVRLRDALGVEETALAERLDRVRSTRARLGQVVAIFEAPTPISVSHAVSVPAATPTPAERKRGSYNRLAPGQWSRKYERCRDCGTTEHSHKVYGYCARCEPRHRNDKELTPS